MLAWGFPHAAIVAGLFLPEQVRSLIWIIALTVPGIACLANARRCGRTHCRYTGPFYLLMIATVAVLGIGLVPVGIPAWLLLGATIAVGGMLVWWFTEREWGKFLSD